MDEEILNYLERMAKLQREGFVTEEECALLKARAFAGLTEGRGLVILKCEPSYEPPKEILVQRLKTFLKNLVERYRKMDLQSIWLATPIAAYFALFVMIQDETPVVPTQPQSLARSIASPKSDCPLWIYAEPESSLIEIDGSLKGQSPVFLSYPCSMVASVSVSHPGFKSQSIKAVVSEETFVHKLRLKRLTRPKRE